MKILLMIIFFPLALYLGFIGFVSFVAVLIKEGGLLFALVILIVTCAIPPLLFAVLIIMLIMGLVSMVTSALGG